MQELQHETQIQHKDLVRALQSLALSKPQQRVLIWRNKRQESGGSRDFGTYVCWCLCMGTI